MQRGTKIEMILMTCTSCNRTYCLFNTLALGKTSIFVRVDSSLQWSAKEEHNGEKLTFQVVHALGRSNSVRTAAVLGAFAARASLQVGSGSSSLPVGAAPVLECVARAFAVLSGRRVIVGAASARCMNAPTALVVWPPSSGLAENKTSIHTRFH